MCVCVCIYIYVYTCVCVCVGGGCIYVCVCVCICHSEMTWGGDVSSGHCDCRCAMVCPGHKWNKDALGIA